MKRFVAVAAILLLLLSLAWFARPLYRRALAVRLNHAAEAAERKHDSVEASRLYALAIIRDPNNLAILRSGAAFFATAHDPQLLTVRERISLLQPDDPGALLDYAEAALLFQQPKLFHHLLRNRAGIAAKDGARYYHLRSISEFLANDLPQADADCTEALVRDPTNEDYLVNQSIIRLSCPDPNLRRTALGSLERCSKDPAERAESLQALLNFAASASQEPDHLAAWLESAQKCIRPRDPLFTTCLSALHRWRPEQFATQLDAYLAAATAPGEDALGAERWLTKNGLCDRALTFGQSLPAAVQSSLEGLLLTAEATYQLRRLDDLSTFLQKPNWDKYPTLRAAWSERLRRALAANAAGSADGSANWLAILTRAGRDAAQLSSLAKMADDWHWQNETEATLWAVADLAPAFAEDALEDLGRRALARGDGDAYFLVVHRQVEEEPDDPVMANNLAFVSFLFRRETARATRISNELCVRFPQSAPVLATNAFGRLTNGDISGGLKMIERVDTKALAGAAPGVTYGLLLAAKGDPAATRFLNDAEHWTHFPEERRLIAEARKKIAR